MGRLDHEHAERARSANRAAWRSTPRARCMSRTPAARVVDVFGAGRDRAGRRRPGKASKLTRTTAILNGIIDGDGKPAKYRFEWGTSEALRLEHAGRRAAGAGEEKVAATLSELHAGHDLLLPAGRRKRKWRELGVEREFTTPPAVEALSTGPVRSLTPTSATLTGIADARTASTAHYYFEWGHEHELREHRPRAAGHRRRRRATKRSARKRTLGPGAPTRPTTTASSATNSFGTTVGEDQTFTTSGPPRITNEPTSAHRPRSGDASTPRSTRTSSRRPTTSNTAKRPRTAAKRRLGGASIRLRRSTGGGLGDRSTGLKLGITYHFRVVATQRSRHDALGPRSDVHDDPPAPIDSESVDRSERQRSDAADRRSTRSGTTRPTTSSTAPKAAQADSGSLHDVPPPPGDDIGAGESDQPGSDQLSGAEAATRPTTTGSSPATRSAPPKAQKHTFTTAAGKRRRSRLPDGRAWEMVTPPDKHGAPVEALTREGGLILASEDGDALTYVVDGALGEEAQGNRSPEWQQVLATRGAERWSSQDIATPSSKAQGS